MGCSGNRTDCRPVIRHTELQPSLFLESVDEPTGASIVACRFARLVELSLDFLCDAVLVSKIQIIHIAQYELRFGEYSLAKDLPSSTPHWSKLLMFQTAPSVNVKCS